MKHIFFALILSLTVLSSCASKSTSLPPLTSMPNDITTTNGPGWTSSGLSGVVEPSGSCHYLKASDGYSLPDPKCTPGVVDSTVTQANIYSTICRKGGYSSSVRPPENLTEPMKYKSMDAYSDPNSTSSTEFDHLIPLGLGGASDLQNLWAEPDEGSPATFDPQDPYGINAKDGVEDKLHQLVCDGTLNLQKAQIAIATNWTTALTNLDVSLSHSATNIVASKY